MAQNIEEEEIVKLVIEEPPPKPPRKKAKMIIPRRAPSIVVVPPERHITAPDYDEEVYVEPEFKILRPCQRTPLTLYELAIKVVDSLLFPSCFDWTVDDVVTWMADDVGLPRYIECIIDNKIDGMRLLMLEEPSKLAQINIRDFEDIKKITSSIRNLYSMDVIKFVRSVGLPPRRPLVHCTWFKSRTGPNWGIRKNWTRGDILRWMKIINPAPVHLDHWDIVWHQRPDYPVEKFARIPLPTTHEYIPHYKQFKEECREYLAPRKFRLLKDLSEDQQMIWMERRPPPKKPKVPPKPKPKPYRLLPKPINLDVLRGDAFKLGRRLTPKKKFIAISYNPSELDNVE